MSEEQDFLKTITLLMRLTREGTIRWSTSEESSEGLPVYQTNHEGMRFRLEDIRFPSSVAAGRAIGEAVAGTTFAVPEKRYRLLIVDTEDETEIISPPLKAAGDLVSLIEKMPRHKRNEKIEEINRRLAAS